MSDTSLGTGTMTRFIFLAASVHSCSEISPSLNVSGGVNVRSSWREDAAERYVDGTNEDGATNAVAPGKSADDDARAVAAAFLRVSDSAGAAFRPSSVSGRLALDVSSIRAQQRPRHEAAALLVSQLLHRGRSGAAARRDAAGAFGRKATIRGLTRAARRGGCVGTVVQDTADLEATLFEAFAPFVSCETDPYPLGQKKAELEARGALLQHNFNRDGAVLSLTLANFTRALR